MLILLFIASLCAFVISALSGGGAGLALLPVLGLVLPIVSVPAALSLGTCASALSRIVVFRRSIRWDVTRWFVPAALPMALVGALSLRFVNPTYMQLGMAVFLMANVRNVLRPEPAPRTVSPTSSETLLVGGAAGFLSGLTGAVGVLFNSFYLGLGLSKEEIVATRATNDVLVHVVKLIVYYAVGLLDGAASRAGALVALAAVCSSFFLKGVLARLPHRLFARLGYLTMVGSGVALLGSSLWGIADKQRISMRFEPLLNGVDAKVLWQHSSLALEVEYDGEIEVERSIPLDALSLEQRALVAREDVGGKRIVLEAVYGIGRRSFEAYYYRGDQLLKKIEFDASGVLIEDDDA